MKKRLPILFVIMAFCLCFFATACDNPNYTKSLVFREIQEDDSYREWAGEYSVIDDTDGSINKLVVPQTYNGKPVVIIGAEVCCGYRYLAEVYLPEGLKVIESFAFSECQNLTNITLPESLLFIGWGAFDRDSELTSISIGHNVFRIAEKAFRDCNKLKDVYYSGSEEDWNKIEIWEDNECLLNADIHFAN